MQVTKSKAKVSDIVTRVSSYGTNHHMKQHDITCFSNPKVTATFADLASYSKVSSRKQVWNTDILNLD